MTSIQTKLITLASSLVCVSFRVSSAAQNELFLHPRLIGSWLDAAVSAIPATLNGECHPLALMPVEGCHHRIRPETSGVPGGRLVDPGLSCRKPSVLPDARGLASPSQATLKPISSATALYGPIHLNQSCYSSNKPRWRISLRSKSPTV